ncbi:ATP-binding protein [Actinomadura chokoriensis]|uniref:ATP-binding protein n=1 Tax=Actinomadura chokoriensis TaxID=454156 RepID=A0ABV4QWD7_9ACTN
MQAPGAARRFIGEWFQDRGIADAYIAQLIVSELVTNALLHGQAPIVVRVVVDESDGLPVLEVADGGDGLPRVQPESDTAINGRGLRMVSALAAEWGTRPLVEGGKVTWAKCAL